VEIRRFAERHHLHVVDIFSDIGRSGGTVKNRLGLRDLLLLVQERGIGAVIAWREDRYARRVRLVKAISSTFFAAGTHIITLEPFVHDSGLAGASTEAALLRPLMQIQAEEELQTIRRRIIPGITTAAHHGRRGGHIPYGYKKLSDGSICIDEDAAPTVRHCFQAVLDGVTVSSLVGQLAQQGV
jgi:DNA invertase Pin-like site-specific DNA recombinase